MLSDTCNVVVVIVVTDDSIIWYHTFNKSNQLSLLYGTVIENLTKN